MLFYKICKLSDISDSKLQHTKELLSEKQREYIASFNEKRQRQSLCVRSLLNSLLCEEFDNLSIDSLCFDSLGKPYLDGSNLYISLTHSNYFVGCAVSTRPVGIDIEKIRQIKDQTVLRVCSFEEQNYLKLNSVFEFFKIWTLKEAYVKASRTKSTVTDISFVKDNMINFDGFNVITNEIDGYVWSVVEIV